MILKAKPTRSICRVHLVRIVCQALFFALFLAVLFMTRTSGSETIGPVERFFHFDPLLGLVSMLASRTFIAAFGFALITVVVTLLFGRYVCGWVCPMGSLVHFFTYLFQKLKWTRHHKEPARHLRWKYLILLFVVVSSVFTLDFAGYLDPLSFLYRSFSAAVLPAAMHATEAATALVHRTGLPFPADRWNDFLHSQMIHTTFRQGAVLGAIFLAVILLNLVRPRFWCRYLCPTGALLGVLSRWHPFKLKADKDKCNSCQQCALHCVSQAGSHADEKWHEAECFHCFSCDTRCPQDAIQIQLTAPKAKPDSMGLSRRELILTSALGIVAAPVLSVSASERPSEKLIRPPGALAEDKFLSKCIRCGECLKVCPTNGLQFTMNEGGLLGFWTPVLVPRIGYCEYYCSLCSQVCPTGAIKPITIPQKQQTRIGTAWIRKNRCMPYSIAEPCRVCEQKCPTSPKAIVLVDTEFMTPDGPIQVKAPIVDTTLCIGCGLCETRCPVEDEPGIYCTSRGETRSEKGFSMPEYGG